MLSVAKSQNLENNYFCENEIFLLSRNTKHISKISEVFSKKGITTTSINVTKLPKSKFKKSILLICKDIYGKLEQKIFQEKLKPCHFIYTYAEGSNASINCDLTDGHLTFPIETADIDNLINVCRDKSQYEVKVKTLEDIRVNLEKIGSLGQYTGSLIHDLNNYNTVCSTSFSGIRLLNNKSINNDRLSFFVEKGLKGSQMINGLSKRYQKFLRANNDETDPIEIYSLSDAVEECLGFVTLDLIKYQITYKTEISKKIKIGGDSIVLIQALMNLIKNSIYAIKDFEARWISIKIKKDKECLRLIVIDSGGGISDQDQRKIFDPLFTTKPVGEGTGFGLNYSKLTLQKLGYDLKYIGKAHTAFSINIPLDKIK
ncbi:MAG: HAMP domain-containing histidine kinase [Halobacteriovoraceae bacterium]|nr:HAMP domain-containing histidine kinase [Halobacteriovoraceae bacterium]